MGARTLCEQTEFFETGFEIDLAEIDADERGVDQIDVFRFFEATGELLNVDVRNANRAGRDEV
jgi:hypothetical protein